MGATSDLLPRDNVSNLLTTDERVEWILEGGREKPGFGLHRYQRILVRRGQMMCEFLKDLGPVFMFPNAAPVQAWLGGEYSVGEAMEIAERLREGKPPEDKEPVNLMQKYFEQADELNALRAHRSVSGPLLTIERK